MENKNQPIWKVLSSAPHAPLKAKVARLILKPTANKTPVRLTFDDGTVWGEGDESSPEMKILNSKSFFNRVGADSKIGLGESYMAGDWTVGEQTDLADLLTPFAERMAHIIPVRLQKFRALVDRKLPHHSKNSLEGSKKNIEAHYDLSNELFEQFLDPSMNYSAAWFASEDQDLESAQLRKIDGILDQAGVKEGTRLLEIGSGWGSLAIRAARRGAIVTTITLSKEQANLAKKRFKEEKVTVDIRLQDYREVTGEFDAIVSVEMIEAVGEEFWPTYFSTIDSLLAPNGKVSIQAITMSHIQYLKTRNSYGWIQKYIFPGGLIPSLEAIDQTLLENTSLKVTEKRSLGQDYGKTLRLWREKFLSNWDSIKGEEFDETFKRLWEFYLAYCEAGFRVGYLDVYQLQITRDE